MKIKDVLGINNAKLIFGNENQVLKNFSKDTRTLKSNDTYVGIKGKVFDGNTFLEEAFKKGAKTCIISGVDINKNLEKKYQDCNLLIVDDTVIFLTLIAKKRRNELNIPIIAVTGSVGKTSTKNIIADVLSPKYKVLKTKGNLNTNIGLALTILSLEDEDMMVLEMGMNQPGEIRELTSIAMPNVAIITNIGTSHIGNLGSRENILKAKLEILEGLQGPLIINNDNDLLNGWNLQNKKYKTITYGIDNISDYQALDITFNNTGSHFKVNQKELVINVFGKHFIYNSLVALVIADLFAISPELVNSKLRNLTLEPHRMELITTKNYTIIDDSYNSSYESVYYALEVLKDISGRKIAVLGDILELGIYGEDIHRKIGKLIIAKKIDVLITVGNLARFINLEAEELGFAKTMSFNYNSNKEAIECINNIKKENNTILVKASHGMNFLEIVKGIKE